jgi:hypothetical protein
MNPNAAAFVPGAYLAENETKTQRQPPPEPELEPRGQPEPGPEQPEPELEPEQPEPEPLDFKLVLEQESKSQPGLPEQELVLEQESAGCKGEDRARPVERSQLAASLAAAASFAAAAAAREDRTDRLAGLYQEAGPSSEWDADLAVAKALPLDGEAPSPRVQKPNTSLADFQVLHVVGRGGFGKVRVAPLKGHPAARSFLLIARTVDCMSR